MEGQLQSIDSAMLTPLVRQALGSKTVEVAGWKIQEVHAGWSYGSAGDSFIHRVSGHARDRGEAVAWSLILKVLSPPADRGQPADFNYWRREADAYASGFLDDLPGGLATPRCFGVEDQPGGDCWIWMEDVADRFRSADDIGPKWPLEHYGVVARHLGQFNGAYLTGQPPPSHPWLSRGWTRHEITREAPAIAMLQESLGHPLVRRAYPPDVIEPILRAWAAREQFLHALDRLPQTLCHFDIFRANIFARRSSNGRWQTVAIDWALVGSGPIGRDICDLPHRGLDSTKARKVDPIVFEGYVDGLRDAGWQGDPREVRFGQTARYAMRRIVALESCLSWLTDESRYAWWQQREGCPMAEQADTFADSARHPPLDWDSEAWELLEEL
jgi:hypothetical protein